MAEEYRLIKQYSINVLVPYDPEAFNELVARLAEAKRLTPEVVRHWIRDATPHAVSLIRPNAESPLWNCLDPVQFSRRKVVGNYEASWFLALSGLEYDLLTGIVQPGIGHWIL